MLRHIMTLFQASGLGREVARFPDWLDGRAHQNSLSPPSGFSSLLIPLQSVSLFPLSSQQAVENAGRRQKDTVLINTNTRPWLRSTGSDRERDWASTAFALSTNCLRNPLTLRRRREGKKMHVAQGERAEGCHNPPVCVEQRRWWMKP